MDYIGIIWKQVQKVAFYDLQTDSLNPENIAVCINRMGIFFILTCNADNFPRNIWLNTEFYYNN